MWLITRWSGSLTQMATLMAQLYALRSGEWRLAGGNLQQLTLQFPAVLRSAVTVSIDFSYPLRDALSGFYRSTFTGERLCGEIMR